MTVTSLSFAALGLVLPIFAAGLMVLGHDLRWSRHYAVQYGVALRHLAELDGFLEWIKRNYHGEPPNPPSKDSPPPASEPPSRPLIPVIPVDGRTNGKSEAEKTVSGKDSAPLVAIIIGIGLMTTPLYSAAPCVDDLELWVDDSTSITNSDREYGISKAVGQLPQVINSCGIQTVLVFHFSNQPTKGEPYSVPKREIVCSGVAGSTDLDALFPGMKKQADAYAQAKCKPEQDKKDAEFKKQFEDTIRKIRDDLLTRKSKGSCTAIMALLKGVSDSAAALTMIISDGAETCHPTATTIPRPRQGSVYFLITRSKDDPDQTAAEGRRDKLLHAAPWLKVFLPFQNVRNMLLAERQANIR